MHGIVSRLLSMCLCREYAREYVTIHQPCAFAFSKEKLYGILSLAHVPPVHVLARVAHCACDSLA